MSKKKKKGLARSKVRSEFGQIKLTEDQSKALIELKEFLKSDERIFTLIGAAGTGKTFLIRELFARKVPNEDRTYVPNTILGVSITHQAVLNLKKSIPNSLTYASAVNLIMEYDVHGNIYFIPRSGHRYFSEIRKYKTIVFDECSMLGPNEIDLVLNAMHPDAKIIFMGDEKQLPPIGMTNDKDSPTFENHNKYVLTEKVRQQKGDYIAELSDTVRYEIENNHDLSFIKSLTNQFNIKSNKGYALSSTTKVIKSFVRNFKEGNDVRITAYRNKRVEELNRLIREELWEHKAEDKFVEGEFIVLNNQFSPNGIPLAYNGQTFTVKKIIISTVQFVECYLLHVKGGIVLPVPTEKGYPIYVNELRKLKEVALRTKDWHDYMAFKEQFADLSYGYTVTNYKIQGSTIMGCYVNLSDILAVGPLSDKRKLQAFYVGISRPTNFLAIF